jgi:hypothetical protein
MLILHPVELSGRHSNWSQLKSGSCCCSASFHQWLDCARFSGVLCPTSREWVCIAPMMATRESIKECWRLHWSKSLAAASYRFEVYIMTQAEYNVNKNFPTRLW